MAHSPVRGPVPSGIDTEIWRGLVKVAGEPMVFVVVAQSQWSAYLCQPNVSRKRPPVLTEPSGNVRF
jgi:hypothetical protein